MTWNYRVMKESDDSLSVYEVYYNDQGDIRAWTAQPILSGFENKEDLIGTLDMIKADCQKDFADRGVLSFSELEKKISKPKNE